MKVAATVHPNSKKARIEKDLFGNLHVYVNQPPLEGKANLAVTAALANYSKTSKASVKILSGTKSKNKLFEILV